MSLSEPNKKATERVSRTPSERKRSKSTDEKSERRSKKRDSTDASVDAGSARSGKEKKRSLTKERGGSLTGRTTPLSPSATRVAGQTTYTRHLGKEDKKAKSKPVAVLWVPEGKSPRDKDFVWVEKRLENGEVGYALLRDPSTVRWDLPDIGGTSAPVVIPVEKRKFDIRKEWSDASKKSTRQFAAQAWESVRKGVQPAGPHSYEVNLVAPGEAAILSNNVANEFMSLHKRLDPAGEEWIRDAIETQLKTLIAARQAAMQDMAAQSRRNTTLALRTQLGVVGNVSGAFRALGVRESHQMPTAPLPKEQLRAPVSPLLPHAKVLSDPYYSALLRRPSLRRGFDEARLEATTFMHPGGGEIKVLCAVPVLLQGRSDALEEDHGTSCVAAVACDWTGACCFFLLEPFAEPDESVAVTAAYPILDYVSFPPLQPTTTLVTFELDAIRFQCLFDDGQHAMWLRDALGIAMCAMYGDGSDSHRITIMRAYSVEFSASDLTYFPRGGGPMNASAAVAQILASNANSDEELAELLPPLHLCMRTCEGRDAVLREWCKATSDFIQKKRALPASASDEDLATVAGRLASIVEQAIGCPCSHDDLGIARAVQQQLEALVQYLASDAAAAAVAARVSEVAILFESVEGTLHIWESRDQVPGKPFEPCFSPEEGTEVSQYEAELEAQRHRHGSAARNPPGIYFAVVCYHGDAVLTDERGNLFSELVVANPSAQELDQLTPDSEDFQWVLRLGGARPTWASDLADWAEIYEKRGSECFRAQFIQAASRMWASHRFPALGFVFDAPIVQRRVGSALILSVLRVDSRDRVAGAVERGGVWRSMLDLEQFTYTTLTRMHADNARIRFLSSSYRNCVRYLHAAVQYHDALSTKLAPQFYLGFLVCTTTAAGTLMLVPEENRTLPPLQKVSVSLPTVEQWRWIQSLNYRRKTTGSFGFPAEVAGVSAPQESESFEESFGRAMRTLEVATGVTVEKFYDVELFPLNEEQTIYAAFAVSYVPQPFVAPQEPIFERNDPHTPRGTVPMTYKLCSLVDAAMIERYWPVVFTHLRRECGTAARKVIRTAHPLAIDEAMRLSHEGPLLHLCDMEKYALLVSCVRQLVIWLETDGETLVDKYGGFSLGDARTPSSVESVIDVAVTNHAASTDPSLYSMKALLAEFRGRGDQEWLSVMDQLRTMDEAMSDGYATRTAAAEAALEVGRVPSGGVAAHLMRSYDDVPNGVVDRTTRPVTVYELPCTLAEFIRAEAAKEGSASRVEPWALQASEEALAIAQEVVDEVVELAAAAGEAALEVAKEYDDIVDRGQEVEETAVRLADTAPIQRLRQEAESAAWRDRSLFFEKWVDVFRGSDANVGGSQPLRVDATAAAGSKNAVFYAGSPLVVNTAADGVRVCLAKAQNTANKLQQLLQVANSAMAALELTQSLQTAGRALAKRERLVGSQDPLAIASVRAEEEPVDDYLVLVSQSHEEFSIAADPDPLRCLSLQKVRGRVRYPSVPSQLLAILVDHLNAQEEDVPAQLTELRRSSVAADALLDMGMQVKAPLLCLLALLKLHAFEVEGQITDSSARQLRELVNGEFFFDYGMKDWLHMELLGGRTILPGMDVLWWSRYLSEAVGEASEDGGSDVAPYSDYEGSWKQMYAETRIRVLLSFGVRTLAEDEVALWVDYLGPLVEYMNFTRAAVVGNAEVTLLVRACPNLVSLDVSHTSVSDEGVAAIIGGLGRLQECSVEGCAVTPQALAMLRDLCARNSG